MTSLHKRIGDGEYFLTGCSFYRRENPHHTSSHAKRKAQPRRANGVNREADLAALTGVVSSVWLDIIFSSGSLPTVLCNHPPNRKPYSLRPLTKQPHKSGRPRSLKWNRLSGRCLQRTAYHLAFQNEGFWGVNGWGCTDSSSY